MPQTLQGFALMFFGAGIGGMLRHAVNRIPSVITAGFPWGTFAINVAGSLVMGLAAGWFAFKGESSQSWRLFLTNGILGGFTTFSAFSLDAALLWERGNTTGFVSYVLGSVLASLAAVFGGLALMRR
ncbi:MAG TPA: fluoride efflux transporter CrcB [Gemmatimonadaceae bacterium]|nr:fluoride efflux transporter CrcB [Gemmatimonadaceae bacterium]